MGATILDGKILSDLVKEELSVTIAKIREHGMRVPQLSVILVGDNPASVSYVKSKGVACGKIGMDSHTYHLPETTRQDEVLTLIDELNRNETVSGILVQLPLPDHFNKDKVISAIAPEKDVDGLHPVNTGKLVKNSIDTLVPCTPAGIIKLLDHYEIPIESKRAVVIGRSDIVGKPVLLLLMHRNATVTICHSKTRNLAETAHEADILIAALGKPVMVDKTFVKPGAAVIDVGVNRVLKEEAWESLLKPGTQSCKDFEKKGYTLVGDVDYEAVAGIAGAITPVPGGVGPMTIAMLLKNTIRAYSIQTGIVIDEP